MTVVIVAGVLLAAVYAGLCALAPLTRCGHCAGTGTRRTALLRRIAPCRACHAGRRIRLGRRLYNHLAHLRREGTR